MYKADPSNYRFEHTKVNVMKGFRYVSYDTTTFSKESGRHYKTSIIFYNVDLDAGIKPSLTDSVVRVSCSCPSYYFYSSYWNKVHGAHARRPLRPYVRKTKDLPERNGLHLPCLCKHLVAFANYLNDEDFQLGSAPVAKAYKPFDTDPVKADKGFKPDPKDAEDENNQDR
jgi:hypothetical protein